MTQKSEQQQELLTVNSGEAFQPFEWSVGKYGSKFLAEIRDNQKFIGIKCPKCGRVYVPPRKVCGRCYVEMDEFVPVSTEGEIGVCAIIQFGFIDPSTGHQEPVPYGYAFIKLDGADTFLPYYIDSTDPEKVKVGARVKAVFEEKRTGTMLDIKHFVLLD